MALEKKKCLACMGTKDILNIFDTYVCEGYEETYYQMLSKCFDIKVSPETGLSDMCIICINKLRDAYYFKLEMVQTVARLLNVSDVRDEPHLKSEYSGDSDGDYFSSLDTKPLLDEKTGALVVKSETDTDKEGSFTKRILNIKEERSRIMKKSTLSAIRSRIRNAAEIRKTRSMRSREATKTTEGSEPRRKRIRIRPRPVKPYSVEPGQTVCAVCGVDCIAHMALITHMNVHYPTYVCHVCGNGFISEQGLKQHMMSHRVGPFYCSFCNKEFQKVNSRNTHVWRVHRDRDPFLCSLCGERFKTYAQRLRHLQEAHGQTEKKYPCPHCDKRFDCSSSRSSHMRSHRRKMRYPCPHCDASYAGKKNLRNHLCSVHGIGEKRYECPVCHKRFMFSTPLKYHMRTHDAQRM